MIHSSAIRQNRRPTQRPIKLSRIGIACLLLVTIVTALLPAFQARANSSLDQLTIDNKSSAVDAAAAIVEHDAQRRFNDGAGVNLFLAPKLIIASWQQPAGLIPKPSLPICPSNMAKLRFRCKTAKDHSLSA